MIAEKGGNAQSAELACRLAAAASLSSCIISRAVTVLLASEAREFFWALDNLSFVCNQYEISVHNSSFSDRLPCRWTATPCLAQLQQLYVILHCLNAG